MKGVVGVLMFSVTVYCRRTKDTLMSYRDQVGWRSRPLTLTSVPCILRLAVSATAFSYHGMARRQAGNMRECCW